MLKKISKHLILLAEMHIRSAYLLLCEYVEKERYGASSLFTRQILGPATGEYGGINREELEWGENRDENGMYVHLHCNFSFLLFT